MCRPVAVIVEAAAAHLVQRQGSSLFPSVAHGNLHTYILTVFLEAVKSNTHRPADASSACALAAARCTLAVSPTRGLNQTPSVARSPVLQAPAHATPPTPLVHLPTIRSFRGVRPTSDKPREPGGPPPPMERQNRGKLRHERSSRSRQPTSASDWRHCIGCVTVPAGVATGQGRRHSSTCAHLGTGQFKTYHRGGDALSHAFV